MTKEESDMNKIIYIVRQIIKENPNDNDWKVILEGLERNDQSALRLISLKRINGGN
jgi:hypothetical protein